MTWQFLIAVLALVAAVLFGGLWYFQTSMVHRFGQDLQNPQDFAPDGTRLATLDAADGPELRIWIAAGAPDQPVMLTFHGNFTSIGPSMARMAPLQAAGYSVVMMQYRGANGAPGQAAETSFASDAREVFDALPTLLGRDVPPASVVIHGMSLGAGVAGQLAAERSAGAVVLEAAPERMCQFWQRRFRGAPMCSLMWRERYDLIDHAAAITAPTLVVHGGQDASIPIAEARALAAAIPNATFVEIPEAGHADLARHGAFDTIRAFVSDRQP